MFETKVKNFIQTHGLISNGDSVLAAVSGGPDSVALMNTLASLASQLGFRLSAAHLNHGLRPEAAGEERFVLAACERLGLECAVGRADAQSFASQSGCSLEEAARELRHEFLVEQAESGTGGRGAGGRKARVALGHTLDDQAETVMMRLIRGAGVRGLSAMRPVSERGASRGSAPGVLFIRPLLSSTRQEILEFLRSRGIAYVEDASNLDQTFLRNRVRHELLALLRERYNPAIVETLGSQAELLNQADDYLTLAARLAYEECASAESAERIELELARLVAYHVCVQGYVLREAYFRLCGTLKDVAFSHIASLSKLVSAGQSGDWVDLPHGAAATLEGTKLVLGRSDALRSDEAQPRELSVQHEPGGRTWLPELSLGIESRLIRKEDLKEGPRATMGGPGTADGRAAVTGTGADGGSANEVFFDLGALSLPLVLRSLRPGDRISPFGMQGSKKVQDLLVDMKVPRHARRNLVALWDGNGMLWLVGVRRGSAAPVKEGTERVLALRTFAAP
jgi:tRNA(Ile)-lysidine synthase